MIKTFNTKPVSIPIKKIVKENDTTNTYIFDYTVQGKPGQFVMMWIPGVDEKPFSIALDDKNELWITVCKVGPATEELFKLKVGDRVGIRGPFGTFYDIEEDDHLALVAGGYGAAPMYFAAHEALKKGAKVEFLVGARNKDLLLYTQKILGLGGAELHISTDDGSAGREGFVTELLKEVMEKEKITKVFTCGPEIMEKFVGQIAEEGGAECFLSVEKYMKCGFGVCGQCAIDGTGVLACKSGPVMDWKLVKKLSEFGKYHRDAQGKKHYF
ncbi:dihydroorotate dehydrogenase electron transfer subunit [Candidatus Peregrinibacteria bacterium]|jgi:dihydroorotate dehydrogenase electron transfer subunit|nr:dihydroorotate dehydrogenase electron transfer subunit [Candidatus Peregrinibacteria bacterium]